MTNPLICIWSEKDITDTLIYFFIFEQLHGFDCLNSMKLSVILSKQNHILSCPYTLQQIRCLSRPTLFDSFIYWFRYLLRFLLFLACYSSFFFERKIQQMLHKVFFFFFFLVTCSSWLFRPVCTILMVKINIFHTTKNSINRLDKKAAQV